VAGPKRGAAANFLSLLRRAPERTPEGHWLAFSDQDDVWLPDKLSRGIAALEALEDARRRLALLRRSFAIMCFTTRIAKVRVPANTGSN